MQTRMPMRAAMLGVAVCLASLIVVTAADQSVMIATAVDDTHGAYLVDGEGNSLYFFQTDQQGEASRCVSQCARNWPPLLADAAADVVAQDDVDAAAIGTIIRPDGSSQVTYHGWPLYRFYLDRTVGSTAGHEVGGDWFLMTVAGTAVGQTDAGDANEADHADAPDATSIDDVMAVGQALYATNCAACHGAAGEGVVGPALDGRQRLSQDLVLVNTILHGVSTYMPGFGDVLDDDQVAALATFVRNAWSNSFGPLDAEEVRRWR